MATCDMQITKLAQPDARRSTCSLLPLLPTSDNFSRQSRCRTVQYTNRDRTVRARRATAGMVKVNGHGVELFSMVRKNPQSSKLKSKTHSTGLPRTKRLDNLFRNGMWFASAPLSIRANTASVNWGRRFLLQCGQFRWYCALVSIVPSSCNVISSGG